MLSTKTSINFTSVPYLELFMVVNLAIIPSFAIYKLLSAERLENVHVQWSDKKSIVPPTLIFILQSISDVWHRPNTFLLSQIAGGINSFPALARQSKRSVRTLEKGYSSSSSIAKDRPRTSSKGSLCLRDRHCKLSLAHRCVAKIKTTLVEIITDFCSFKYKGLGLVSDKSKRRRGNDVTR